MYSDHSSSASPAGKVRSFLLWEKDEYHTLKFDFHTVCTECKGSKCGLKTRCIECTDVDESHMQDYICLIG